MSAFGALNSRAAAIVFDCGACKKNPDKRRTLGCGKPPLIPLANGQTVEWDPMEWDGKAPPAYAYANFGGVATVLGPDHAWDCCPRFYDPSAGFVSRVEAEEAERILELNRWVDRGALSAVHDGPLTPFEARMLDLTSALVGHLKSERLREDVERQRQEHKSKGSRHVRR